MTFDVPSYREVTYRKNKFKYCLYKLTLLQPVELLLRLVAVVPVGDVVVLAVQVAVVAAAAPLFLHR